MKTGYKELVGLQVTFDTALPRYRLVHYYRWKRIPEKEVIAVLEGYDMERLENIEDIKASFLAAYKPVVLSVWKGETVLHVSTYLQFEAAAAPADVPIEGIWHVDTSV
jgi:hypothetical protein